MLGASQSNESQEGNRTKSSGRPGDNSQDFTARAATQGPAGGMGNSPSLFAIRRFPFEQAELIAGIACVAGSPRPIRWRKAEPRGFLEDFGRIVVSDTAYFPSCPSTIQY